MNEAKEKTPKPEWLKVRPPAGEKYLHIKEMLGKLKLATVCQEARCPNMAECWSGGTATFMLMGDVCTRGCKFCAVKTGNPKGVIDNEEPYKVGFAIAQMDLDYVVITSVDRDDLPDEGSGHFAKTIETIKSERPEMIVEILTPDFKGQRHLIEKLVQAKPDVFAHNVETVERLQRKVRDPRANYAQSLGVLKMIKEMNPKMYTKTSIMLGLGETDEEVTQTLKDLRSVGCDVVTFGQYLQPTKRHLPVIEFVTPEKFEKFLDDVAKEVGANMAKMKKDMEGEEVKSRIEADMAEAKKFGFQGTPGFLVSGISLKGAYPQPEFEKIIDKVLAEKGGAKKE